MKIRATTNFLLQSRANILYGAIARLLSLPWVTAHENEANINIDYDKIIQFIDENIERYLQIVNTLEMKEEGVLFFGNSRVGKGTSVNYAAGVPLVAKEYNGNYVIQKKDPTKNLSSSISHEFNSDTFFPGIVSLKQKDYIDFSGFLENRGVHYEIVNAFIRKKILGNYKKIKIVLVTSHVELQGDSNGSFIKAIKGLSDFLGINNGTDFNIIKDSVSLLITKVNFSVQGVKPIPTIKKKIEDLLKQIGGELTESQTELVKYILDKNKLAIFSAPKQEGDIPTVEKDSILTLIDDNLIYAVQENLKIQSKISEQHETQTEGIIKEILSKIKPGTNKEIKDIGKEILININQELRGKITDVSTINAFKDAIKNIVESTSSLKDFINKLSQHMPLSEALLNYTSQVDGRLEFLTSLFVAPTEEVRKYQRNWAEELGINNQMISLVGDANKKVELKNNKIIEGAFLKVSDIVETLKDFKVTPKYLEIRAGSSITIDADLILPGVNVSIIAPSWYVTGKYTINLNGLDGIEYTKNASDGEDHDYATPKKGHYPGEVVFHDRYGNYQQGKKGDNGKHGDPGLPGSNAGNFYGYGYDFPGIKDLIIVANGGNGGKGQNGGNGKDGSGLDSWITLNTRAKKKTFCYDVGQGGDAGKGGEGGYGGYKGIIKLLGVNGKQIGNYTANDGAQGVSGELGKVGEGGKGSNNCGIREGTSGNKYTANGPRGELPNGLNSNNIKYPSSSLNAEQFEKFSSKAIKNYLNRLSELYKLVNKPFFDNLCQQDNDCIIQRLIEEYEKLKADQQAKLTELSSEQGGINKKISSTLHSMANSLIKTIEDNEHSKEEVKQALGSLANSLNSVSNIASINSGDIVSISQEIEKELKPGGKELKGMIEVLRKLMNLNIGYTINHDIKDKYINLKKIKHLLDDDTSKGNIKINLYTEAGNIYHGLKDNAKALECWSRAYAYTEPFSDKEGEVRALIDKHDQDSFKRMDFRFFVSDTITVENELMLQVKSLIQESVLNKIYTASYKGYWDKTMQSSGVVSYLKEGYIKKQLESWSEEASKDIIEIVHMLSFEAINLGIMHSKDKNFTCAKEFAKAYPQVVNKVAEHYPDFFVDCKVAYHVGLYIDNPLITGMVTEESMVFVDTGTYSSYENNLDQSIPLYSYQSTQLNCTGFNFTKVLGDFSYNTHAINE